MKFFLTILLMFPLIAQAKCWWPVGDDAYKGNAYDAIMRFKEYPLEDRLAIIKQITTKKPPTDHVLIHKDRIESIGGYAEYQPEIEGMHFGKDKVSWSVDRSCWPEGYTEYATVHCSGPLCVIIPSCNNYSIVVRTKILKEILRVPEPSTILLLLFPLLYILRKK